MYVNDDIYLKTYKKGHSFKDLIRPYRLWKIRYKSHTGITFQIFKNISYVSYHLTYQLGLHIITVNIDKFYRPLNISKMHRNWREFGGTSRYLQKLLQHCVQFSESSQKLCHTIKVGIALSTFFMQRAPRQAWCRVRKIAIVTVMEVWQVWQGNKLWTKQILKTKHRKYKFDCRKYLKVDM